MCSAALCHARPQGYKRGRETRVGLDDSIARGLAASLPACRQGPSVCAARGSLVPDTRAVR